MSLTKEGFLAELESLGISYEIREHAEVLTVDAQVEVLGEGAGTVAKNLFLKDKRNRYYIVTALPSTKVDMKTLSARLGTGKGGVRMAPNEKLAEVLQVSAGCVTPVAACRPSASDVILLFDEKLKSVKSFFVHPLVNTASVSISAEGLEKFLKSCGRNPVFVDFENAPPIDNEHPPDLKAVADAVKATKSEESKPATNPSPSDGGGGGKKAKGGSKKSEKSSATKSKAPVLDGDDVKAVTEILMKKMAALDGKADAETVQVLTADIEMELNAFRNAAYTRGYLASKDEMVAFCNRTYR
ncbi:hypothetical protein BSKO_07143 [Bryopsis sp. KO-2023]|nr:hypothetical protein BSKO_07143 [Bryopsis sp. KO-2023]